MPIGSVPANSTKAGATEFVLNMDVRVWDLTQITSWWEGVGAFVPGTSVATSFDLWYKFKLPEKFYNYYTTIGVTVRILEDPPAGFFPTLAHASLCNVTTEGEEQLLYEAGRGQIYTRRNAGNYYYIQVKTPNQNRVAEAKMAIHVDTFIRKISVVGAVAVQDLQQLGAIVVANPLVNFGPNANADIAHIWVAEDAHSFGGTGGDVLTSGVTCIQDSALAGGGVTVRSRNYRDPISFPNMLVTLVARDSTGTVFWIHWVDGPESLTFVRSIHVGAGGTGTATLGPIISLPIHTNYSIFYPSSTNLLSAMRVHNNVLYYSFFQSNTIYRWDLTTNSAMPVFLGEEAPGAFGENRNYFGYVTDILVAPNGDLLVGFYNNANADDELPPFGVFKPFTVRRYNSAGAFLATYFNFNINPPAHYKMNYGEDPNFFYIWSHQTSSGYPSSLFGKVRFSDGVLDHWIFAHEFLDGAMLYTGSLYSGNRQPAQSWGTNQRHNFWINPLDIAIPPIPVDPPIEPPPGEPPTPVGGGLIVLDPDNPVRHDVYMDKTGLPYNSTIIVTLATAYLGD